MATTKRQSIDQAQPEERPAPSAGGSRVFITDVYSWAKQQAEAMQKREYDKMDWDNLIEEIAEMSASIERTWVSNAGRAMEHMIKMLEWPGNRGYLDKHIETWRFEIDGAKNPGAYRTQMAEAILDNKGLKNDLDDMLVSAWGHARTWAAKEFAIAELGEDHPKYDQRRKEIRKAFPEKCPWNIVEVAGYNPRERKNEEGARRDVWPGEVAAVLNETLGTNYPVCGWDAKHDRGPAMSNDELAKLERSGDWKQRKAQRGKRANGGRGRAHQSMAELARQSLASEKPPGRSR